MVVRRVCYTPQDLDEALDRAHKGEKFAIVARTSSIPLRTLFKKSKELATTGALVSKRRGPKPALTTKQEADLVTWIAGMQRAGFPVGAGRVLERANEVYERLHRTTRAGKPFRPLTKGWYRRFKHRHPVLATRTAQKIARVRNTADSDSIRRLFHAVAKRVIELQLSADRVYNMDETSFMPKGTTSKVLALKGSNVWSKETRPNFHMTVVAAVSASGTAIPPLVILPGKRIYKTDKAAISIKGARVTGAPKGFSNGRIFRMWLNLFVDQVKQRGVQFPVVLVLDNSSTHLDLESIGLAHEMGVMMLAFPPNATHMYQPLDVAVFKPFKNAGSDALESKLHRTAKTTLSKKDSIQIACEAYQSAIIDCPDNSINGFATTGLFPPSIANMTRRLKLYSDGGAKGDVGKDDWLKRKREEIRLEARDDILTLPPDADKAPKRLRVTVDIDGVLVGNDEALL